MRALHLAMIGLLVGGCFTDGGGAQHTTSGAMTSTGEASTGPTGGETDPTGSPEGQVCDPFAQDCPDGYKCAPYASDGGDVWDANKCVPVTGNDAPGQGCSADGGGTSGYDTCVAGAMCTGVTAKGVGTCVSLCSGSARKRSNAGASSASSSVSESRRQSAAAAAAKLDLPVRAVRSRAWRAA